MVLLALISNRRASYLTSGGLTFSKPWFSNQGKLIYEKYKNFLPSNATMFWKLCGLQRAQCSPGSCAKPWTSKWNRISKLVPQTKTPSSDSSLTTIN